MENLFEMIESYEDVIKIQDDIERTRTISLDVETTGFDFKDDKLRLVQIRINNHTYLMNPSTLPKKVIQYIIELLDASGKPVLAHNAKFDLKFIYENYGVLFRNVHCSMITEYLITEAREKFASYQELAYKYLGELVEKETVEQFLNNPEMTQEMLLYGAIDVLHLEPIMDMQMELIKERGLEKVYRLEMDLVPVVTKIESNGVMLNQEAWTELYIDAEEKSKEMERNIIGAFWKLCKDTVIPTNDFENVMDLFDYWNIPYKKTQKAMKEFEKITMDNLDIIEEMFMESLNTASPRQMKTAFQIMGAKVDSTAEKVLKSLAKDFPIAGMMLEFRKNFKRVTTYGLDFLTNVKEDGRIYARFNQIGTTTGRFSSRSPNLQNIIRGSAYRQCFIAPQGKKMITADYSQQEFRLAGELSGEPAIIEAYQKGADMHTATAAMLYDVPLEEVTKEQRSAGKTVNFAVLYGSSAYGLARTMGISSDEAEAVLSKFKTGFPRLSAFQHNIQDVVWKLRYSVTPTGRRRGFKKASSWETSSEFYKFKGRIDREGFNHVVQGGSADMLKYALLMLDHDNPWGDRFKIVMTVHDEVVCEVDEDLAQQAKEFVEKTMIKAGEIFMKHIPAEVDAVIADYWSK